MSFREKISQNKQKVKLLAVTAVPTLLVGGVSVPAFASDGTDTSVNITDTLVSSFTDIGNDILDMFSKVLPIALPILGAAMVIGIGIAIFKKVTKKSSGG